MTTSLRDLLEAHVSEGAVPGAVALLARGEQVEVQAVGAAAVGGAAPMARDSIFRIASITKPITAAAVMLLVDDGRIALEDPVERWLPELAVARWSSARPRSPVDDVVPAVRPITVLDLLTSRAGYGWPSDFSLPQVERLFDVQTDGREVQLRPDPDEWLARLAPIPLLYQPGEAWLYDTCSDLQGILISRVSGRPLPEFFAERLFEPLGMVDTAFEVPAAKRDRFTSYYRRDPAGGLELADAPDGAVEPPAGVPGRRRAAWPRPSTTGTASPACSSAAARSTAAASCRAASVRQMTSTTSRRPSATSARCSWRAQGWGFGGSVDDAAIDPWNVPGRYGWVGGTGTTAHIVPSTGTVAILLTQVALGDPVAPAIMRDFWRHAPPRRPPPRRGARPARRSGRCASPPRGSRRARRGGSRRAA